MTEPSAHNRGASATKVFCSDRLVHKKTNKIKKTPINWGITISENPSVFIKKYKKNCSYSSGKYKENGNIRCIDAEILAISYAIDGCRILIILKK